ncbi:MAG: hypothetical protein SVY15_03030 [Halobacteriota archaeon]|nr:hypothetical protein [Halobacteriota archaeon]
MLKTGALDGWNKALRNVNREAGEELLTNLGKEEAERVGRHLAFMSDEAAELMVTTDIGKKL